MGVTISVDFAFHPGDHEKLGVVGLSHLFPSSSIGVCTLKGKFQSQTVCNFIDTLVAKLSGFQAELKDWEVAQERPPTLYGWGKAESVKVGTGAANDLQLPDSEEETGPAAIEPATVEETNTSPCSHQWVVPIAIGPARQGVCAFCGEVKEFKGIF